MVYMGVKTPTRYICYYSCMGIIESLARVLIITEANFFLAYFAQGPIFKLQSAHLKKMIGLIFVQIQKKGSPMCALSLDLIK